MGSPSRILLLLWLAGNAALMVGHTRLAARLGLAGLGFTDPLRLALWSIGSLSLAALAWRLRSLGLLDVVTQGRRAVEHLVEPRPRRSRRAYLSRLGLACALLAAAVPSWSGPRPLAWLLVLSGAAVLGAALPGLVGVPCRVRPRIAARTWAFALTAWLLAELVNALAFTLTKAEESQILAPHPQGGLMNRPGHRDVRTTIDTHGFRAPRVPVEDLRQEQFVVLLLGGSTVFGWTLRDEETFGPTLESALQSRGLPDPVVLNAATPGWHTWEEARRFRSDAARWPLDAVVFLHGRNDLYWGWLAGTAPAQGSPSMAELRYAVPDGLTPGRLQLLGERSLVHRALGGSLFPRPGRPSPSDPQAQGREIARVYGGNMRAVAAVAAERRLRTLVLLQPILYAGRDLLPQERGLLETELGWAEGYWTCLPALQAAAAGLPRSEYFEQRSLLDALDRGACPEAAYVDECHYTPAATRVLATRIADALLSR